MTTNKDALEALNKLIDCIPEDYKPNDADDWIKLIRKALLATQWQPIETAPLDCTEILLSGKAVESYEGMYVCEGYGWTDGDKKTLMRHFSTSQGKLENQPTHWMPLPLPPSVNIPIEDEYYSYAKKIVQEICKPYNRKSEIMENIIKEYKNNPKKFEEN